MQIRYIFVLIFVNGSCGCYENRNIIHQAVVVAMTTEISFIRNLWLLWQQKYHSSGSCGCYDNRNITHEAVYLLGTSALQSLTLIYLFLQTTSVKHSMSM